MALDPDALLCERCGYHLAGLSPDARCPECGKAVAESLPSRRIGSAWQQGPSAIAWIRTALLPLRYPVHMWERVRVDTGSDTYMFALLTLFGPAWLVATALAMSGGEPHYVGRATFAASLTGLFYLVLLGAFQIETMGIRFFGRSHRWRIDGAVAYSVCAHATPGWFVGALTSAVVILVWPGPERPVWPLSLGALLGLLSFETLVYIGMRQMRFANRPGASLTPQPPTPE